MYFFAVRYKRKLAASATAALAKPHVDTEWERGREGERVGEREILEADVDDDASQEEKRPRHIDSSVSNDACCNEKSMSPEGVRKRERECEVAAAVASLIPLPLPTPLASAICRLQLRHSGSRRD